MERLRQWIQASTRSSKEDKEAIIKRPSFGTYVESNDAPLRPVRRTHTSTHTRTHTHTLLDASNGMWLETRAGFCVKACVASGTSLRICFKSKASMVETNSKFTKSQALILCHKRSKAPQERTSRRPFTLLPKANRCGGSRAVGNP